MSPALANIYMSTAQTPAGTGRRCTLVTLVGEAGVVVLLTHCTVTHAALWQMHWRLRRLPFTLETQAGELMIALSSVFCCSRRETGEGGDGCHAMHRGGGSSQLVGDTITARAQA